MIRAASIIAVMICLAGAPVRGQSIWELTPYRVQIYLAFEDAPQITPAMAADIQAFLGERIESLIGASWNTTLTAAPLELSVAMVQGLAPLTTEQLPKESLKADKVLLVALSADSRGYRLQGRELDCRTRIWGATVSRDVFQPILLASAATDVMLAAFAPLAQIEKVDGKTVELRLRAASLPPRDPKAIRVATGTLFRPVIRFNDRDGNLRADKPPQPIPWTYLLTRGLNETLANCEMFSGLRSPLSTRRRGRTEQLAVAVRPPEAGTLLIVHSRLDRRRLLSGYEIFAYGPDSPATTLLGRTDSQGQIWIEPSDSPLRMLVIKSGGEFLARLPLVPGIEHEALAAVADDDDRLAVEGYITGLQEEIVDLVARRAMLVARIRARLDDGKLEDAQQLLSELRQMRGRDELGVVLNEQRRKYFSSDLVVRRKVDKLFNDTREVMVRNLDPRLIDQVASEVDQAVKAAGSTAITPPANTGAAATPMVR
jgi:hypothetical protein